MAVLLAVSVFATAFLVVLPHAGISTAPAERITKLTDLGDESLKERNRETSAAFDTWKASPVAGVGAGHEFTWRAYGGRPRRSFLIDSPLGFVAKFGVVGVFALALAVVSVGAFVHQRRRDPRSKVGGDALLAFGAVALLGLVLGVPLEDKGFGLGFLLLLALALPDAQESETPTACV